MAEGILKKIGPSRIALILLSLAAFVLALTMMKEGSTSFAPEIEALLDLSGTMHSLGFGWLAATLILSGSPVAAAALTFFDAEAIQNVSAFAMIIGSRVGGSFVVLLIGFYYIVKGADRARSLGIGLLALIVSATMNLPALPLGALLLDSGILDWARFPPDSGPYRFVSSLFDPVAQATAGLITPAGAFVAGLGLIILSLNLFDRALPDMEEAEEERKLLGRNVDRPWVMFGAGAIITFFSLSVTISLSILVPLSRHNIVRRKYVVPYIMGANITTLIDTLFAAVVMENPEAATIVLAGWISITLIAVAILVTVYRGYEKLMLGFTEWVLAGRLRLGLFMAAFAVIPLVLLLA